LSLRKSYTLYSVLLLLFVSILAAGCCTASGPTDKPHNIDELSQHYRQHHDYQSLVSLLPYLNTLTMCRSEVEALLGESALCPTANICYYGSEKSIPAECPRSAVLKDGICRLSSGEEIAPLDFHLALLVRYDVTDSVTALPEDRLTQFELTTVGE
jgi:hypothetical protein